MMVNPVAKIQGGAEPTDTFLIWILRRRISFRGWREEER